jgi:hypothetical protein
LSLESENFSRQGVSRSLQADPAGFWSHAGARTYIPLFGFPVIRKVAAQVFEIV